MSKVVKELLAGKNISKSISNAVRVNEMTADEIAKYNSDCNKYLNDLQGMYNEIHQLTKAFEEMKMRLDKNDKIAEIINNEFNSVFGMQYSAFFKRIYKCLDKCIFEIGEELNDLICEGANRFEERPVKDKAVQALGHELDRIYNQGGSWTINGIRPTMSEVAGLYDVYKHIVRDHIDKSKITTISQTVSDILKSLGFKVKEQGVGWCLTESDDFDDSEWAQPRDVFNVTAFTNSMEMAFSPKRFKDPGKAIECWFKLEQKYPTCVMITGYLRQAQELHQWSWDNEDKIREWAKKYNCPYDVEYILDACNKPVHRSTDKYPDQCHPYDLG